MGETIQKTTTRSRQGEVAVDDTSAAAPKGDLIEKTDTLLDQIDSVLDDTSLDALLNEVDLILEPNAVEFAQQYVQRGGE